MKVMERNVMRLLAVQHLRAAHGIKVKNWNKNKAAGSKSAAGNKTKVFGVSLESLPYYNMECGRVPSFLVDACMNLLAHVDTEGLFRKSGSVVRLKALRVKLDAGEECLSTALPCDVAGLVKQFFRELPEPVLPTELQEAFLKAQQISTEEERSSATLLLSCILPERNLSVLRHFFDFLYNVSQRSAENKMDSSNLSVILAPNLLHSGDCPEKINANTEKRLKLQAAVVHCFIENATSFGVLPRFLLDKVPGMMGCEAGALSPNGDDGDDLDSGIKKKHRRSFGDLVSGALSKIITNRTPTRGGQADGLVFSSATPVIATPSSKRKLPMESGHSFGFSNKKRRSMKKHFGIDLLPNTLFSGASTPGSACSASGVLDSSQTISSPAGRSKRRPATSIRRKSRRLSSRHVVSRVESGRAGCFSPKAEKKEAPRKSLRLRFSLGRSSRDAGSESIGWRLATQESATSFVFTKEPEFSPSVHPKYSESKSSKYISKSEDNLLSPHASHRISWDTPLGAQGSSGGSFTDTPMKACLKSICVSEPAIVVTKPPAGVRPPQDPSYASSTETLESKSRTTEPRNRTLLETEAVMESAAELEDVSNSDFAKPKDDFAVTPQEKVPCEDTEASSFTPQRSLPGGEHNVTFGLFEVAALSPLHIDSFAFESGVCRESVSAAVRSHIVSLVQDGGSEAEQVNCSRLIDALDIQSPAHFTLGVSAGLQSTPYKPGVELRHGGELCTPPRVAVLQQEEETFPPTDDTIRTQRLLLAETLETEKRRVADHIQHFNKLTLHSPRSTRAQHSRPPLTFQRTPVRQAVRRINSLLGESRRPPRKADPPTGRPAQVVKSVSLESGLSPRPQLQPRVNWSTAPVKKPPPVPPKKPSAHQPAAGALGDVTNVVQPKARPDLSGAEKSMNHYRGSPRNPLTQGRLLSATKPVDL